MKHFDATGPARAVVLAALGALVALSGATAAAADADVQIQAVGIPVPDKVEPVAAKPSPFGGVAAVGLQRLTGSRGGASTTHVDLGGVVKDATATNVSTGNNAIRDGSFGNAVGFNTVIQNSGANVLIQNSMTVNVQFK